MIENVNVAKCLEFAVENEKIAASLYARLARRFASNRELSDLFTGLGQDELLHAAEFQALYDRISPQARARAISYEHQNSIHAASVSEIFSADDALGKDVGSIVTREDALHRALLLERSTLAYYQAVRDILGADEVLDSLIAVEKGHVAKVMQLMITGAEFRGMADSF